MEALSIANYNIVISSGIRNLTRAGAIK